MLLLFCNNIAIKHHKQGSKYERELEGPNTTKKIKIKAADNTINFIQLSFEGLIRIKENKPRPSIVVIPPIFDGKSKEMGKISLFSCAFLIDS